MKKNYKVVYPPQKYLELPKIYAVFGSKPVIAYGCKVKKETPQGGFIVAVQNEENEPSNEIKAYMKQLKERFPEKEPIYYICVREDAIIYDKGNGEVKTLPEIEEKPSLAQQRIDEMDEELLVMAIITALRSGEADENT